MKKQTLHQVIYLTFGGLCLVTLGVLAIRTSLFTNHNSGGPFVNPSHLSNDETLDLATATFGGGCFWCTEAVYQEFDGVHRVESGYAGGALPNPTYHDVCSGISGHAEVIQITYDPKVISYATLLEAFWQSHDPTTLNRQGNDIGTQYRSIILYHNEDQKRLAAQAIRQLNEAGVFGAPVVTELAPFMDFYPADESHQNFYRSNKTMRYCTAIIEPKVEKIRKLFSEQLHSTKK